MTRHMLDAADRRILGQLQKDSKQRARRGAGPTRPGNQEEDLQ